MIRIADYTEKLDRLNHSGRGNEAQREFDRRVIAKHEGLLPKNPEERAHAPPRS
jgi:hypothetical protein